MLVSWPSFPFNLKAACVCPDLLKSRAHATFYVFMISMLWQKLLYHCHVAALGGSQCDGGACVYANLGEIKAHKFNGGAFAVSAQHVPYKAVLGDGHG